MGRMSFKGLRIQLSGEGFDITPTTENRASKVTVGGIEILPPEGEEDFEVAILDNIISHVGKTPEAKVTVVKTNCEMCGTLLGDVMHCNRFPCEDCGKVVCDDCSIDFGEHPDKVRCLPCDEKAGD